jgi:hypothetical protein
MNKNTLVYITAVPNIGAGIGHKIANWIAGYSFSKLFDINFAHTEFQIKNQKIEWDDFLGLGYNQIKSEDLIYQGYAKVLLPLFNDKDENQINIIKNLINININKKILFVLAQDQPYSNPYDCIDFIQNQFQICPSRSYDMDLDYKSSDFNVAIHIRREDVNPGTPWTDLDKITRLIDAEWYLEIIKKIVMSNTKTDKKIRFYLFTNSNKIDEFNIFNDYDIIFNNCDEWSSFLHIVRADMVITSRSGFSYFAALLNSNGIIISPPNFWHIYPNTSNWIIYDGQSINELQLF